MFPTGFFAESDDEDFVPPGQERSASLRAASPDRAEEKSSDDDDDDDGDDDDDDGTLLDLQCRHARLQAAEAGKEPDESAYEDRVVEAYRLHNGATTLFAFVSPRRGIAFQLWPAASALCRYLERAEVAEELLRGKTVVELGAGTGLVGIGAAALGAARVLITDLEIVMPFLNQNIDVNRQQSNDFAEAVQAHPIPWGEPLLPMPAGVERIDTLLLADCVYWEILFEPLVTTLQELCQWNVERGHLPPVAIMCQVRRRRRVENRFFAKLSKHGFAFPMVDRIESPGVRGGIALYRIERVGKRAARSMRAMGGGGKFGTKERRRRPESQDPEAGPSSE